MSVKQKFKSAWNKLTGKFKNKSGCNDCGCKHNGCGHDGCGCTDSELGADEVVRKEVFPKPKADRRGCTRKPASKRTRPTNDNYEMIDPGNDTADSSKS